MIATASSFQLEFNYLSHATKNPVYAHHATTVNKIVRAEHRRVTKALSVVYLTNTRLMCSADAAARERALPRRTHPCEYRLGDEEVLHAT